jgi:two-component system, NarL family, invasion response regulator UvrY
MRVLVADDHQIVREGIRRILTGAPGFTRIEEAGTANEVMERLRQGRFDAVLLDINLPGRSGLEALKDIRREYPFLPVLVLSMYSEDQFGVRVMRAGAAGYLSKATAANVLVDALHQVCSGKKFITPQIAQAMASALEVRADTGPVHTLLSDREFEVFRLIARGKTVGEIAAELHLSVKTISTYRTHILLKMHLRNNADMMRYAVDKHLLE